MNYWNKENIDKSMKQIFNTVREDIGIVIGVVGDTILDEYLFGQMRESNVDIFKQHKQELYPGGAANVAMNVTGLGGECAFLSITGCCDKSKAIHDIMNAKGIDTRGIVSDKSIQTCCITRFISDEKLILRYDNKYENNNVRKTQERLYHKLRKKAKDFRVLVISDYKKGCITNDMFNDIKKMCISNNIRLLIDCKSRFDLQDVYLLKINRQEFCSILDKEKCTDYEIEKESLRFKRANKIEFLIITMDKEGLLFIDKENFSRRIPSFCNEIVDSCGAGDTMIAALAICVNHNIDIWESVLFANLAAGVSSRKKGTSTISIKDMETYWDKLYE